MIQRPQIDALNSDDPPSENRQEFASLYQMHARELYCYIRTLVPNQTDAEDTFQDVSAVLWQKFGQFQSGTNFMAWAARVAKYCVLNLRDYQRRSKVIINNEFIEAVAGEFGETKETIDAHFRALADCYTRLSSADRKLVDNRYQGGTSIKDLAEQMGRPLRTVYRLFERIHITLLNCIERKIRKEGTL
jgi:RNA polymerase sigma-70 factor (ECF subfamily)